MTHQASPKAPPPPTVDEMIDVLCEISRDMEWRASIPVLQDRGDRVRVHPDELRKIRAVDAAIVELTQLKYERRNRSAGRGW